MKKILSLMLACMCLCTNLVMASNEPSQSTNVTLDMPTSYTWKAPASLELNEDSPVTGTVEVTENIIPEGSKLVISLDAGNNFTVTSDEGATRTYTITKGETSVLAGDTIMEVAAGTNNASQVLNFAVESISGGKKAGTFKGTANFTASVEVPVTLISFTIGSTSYQAEEGMTWGEWVNSEYNTDGFRASGYYVKIGAGGDIKYIVYSGTRVVKTESIISDAVYSLFSENIISFTINEVVYSANNGMTWEEWVNTDLNTDGFIISKNSVINPLNETVTAEKEAVLPADVIIQGYEYITQE